MEGYLWLYIFLLAELPWWWRINHPSCLFPEWCSAVLLNTTASLNLNVRSPSAAAQDKANQHQMPPRWTYCLALESLTLSLLLINIIQPNPRVHFSQTTAKPHRGPRSPSEAQGGRRDGGRHSATTGAQHAKARRPMRSPSLHPASLQCQPRFWSTQHLFTHWNSPIWRKRDWSWVKPTYLLEAPKEPEESHGGRWNHTATASCSPFTLPAHVPPLTLAKLGLPYFTFLLHKNTQSCHGKHKWKPRPHPNPLLVCPTHAQIPVI